MALITNLLIKTGLMRAKAGEAPSPPQSGGEDEQRPPLVVHVEDLAPEALAQLEADGLVHLEDTFIAPLKTPSKETRVVLLRDLLAHAALEQQEQTAETTLAADLGLNATLEDVLAASQLQAQPGEWSIDRALHWLDEHRGHASSRKELRAAFQGALLQAEVSEARVLSDAALRDRAVDKYEAILKKRVRGEVARLSGERDSLNQRITALQAQADTLAEQQAKLAADLDDWCTQKEETEVQWASVINLLIPGAGDTIVGGRELGEDE